MLERWTQDRSVMHLRIVRPSQALSLPPLPNHVALPAMPAPLPQGARPDQAELPLQLQAMWGVAEAAAAAQAALGDHLHHLRPMPEPDPAAQQQQQQLEPGLPAATADLVAQLSVGALLGGGSGPVAQSAAGDPLAVATGSLSTVSASPRTTATAADGAAALAQAPPPPESGS